MIVADLADCSIEEQTLFAETRITPSKWSQKPWGDEGGGFWAVAVRGDRVLWFNDIEYGFNVSQYLEAGTIPRDQYWCNQDPLTGALPALIHERTVKAGPPTAVPDS